MKVALCLQWQLSRGVTSSGDKEPGSSHVCRWWHWLCTMVNSLWGLWRVRDDHLAWGEEVLFHSRKGLHATWACSSRDMDLGSLYSILEKRKFSIFRRRWGRGTLPHRTQMQMDMIWTLFCSPSCTSRNSHFHFPSLVPLSHTFRHSVSWLHTKESLP